MLLDCGLFQGHRAEAVRKNKELPFDPKSLQHVILSHAHIDHSGGLPILAKRGYAGPIHCTQATRELCGIMLLDSGHLQEADARFYNKIHAGRLPPIEPLYTEEEAEACLARFQTHPYNEERGLAAGLSFRLYNASHVLGSAMIEVEAEGRRLLFTGDLGRRRTILMDPPEIPRSVDALLIESTYGDRLHDPITLVEGQLKAVIDRAVAQRSKILIPSFALERAQEIIFVIEKLIRQKTIPVLPLYVDSPMTISITEIFNRHISGFSFSPEFRDYVASQGNPFQFPNVHYVRLAQESQRLNDLPGPMIILSASGMCEGGRILHHLRNNLDNPATTVLLVGYQAEGTLGRRLQTGAKKVKIFGVEQEVAARVETMHTFSAHADQADLLWFIGSLNPRPRRIFLVHGDNERRVALKNHLAAAGIDRVECPDYGQSFELD